jgi:hypothetical protein
VSTSAWKLKLPSDSACRVTPVATVLLFDAMFHSSFSPAKIPTRRG